MIVVPAETPVTATTALLKFPAIVTLDGTVATAGLLELRLRVNPPAGAGADNVSVRFWVLVPVIDKLVGEKLAASATVTDWLAVE